MMSKELILEWVNGLPDDAEVGIKESSMTLEHRLLSRIWTAAWGLAVGWVLWWILGGN